MLVLVTMTIKRSTGLTLAVGAICLILGSTGGAVAGGLITGKQIAKNAISSRHIEDKTITIKDLNPKTRSKLTGPAGAPGPEGSTGPAGPVGPEGSTGPARPAGFVGATIEDKFIALSTHSVAVTGSATDSFGHVKLSDSSPGTFTFDVPVPRTHQSSDGMFVDVSYALVALAEGCTWNVAAFGLYLDLQQQAERSGTWEPSSGGSTVNVPPNRSTGTVTFKFSDPLSPGSYVRFNLSRNPTVAADTCNTDILIRSLNVRY